MTISAPSAATTAAPDEPERERMRVGRGGSVDQGRAVRVREAPGDADRSADRLLCGLSRIGCEGRGVVLDPGRVERRGQRADHGDAEGARDLAGDVVHRRGDARLLGRHRAHHGGGGGRHHPTHAGCEEEEPAAERPVRRRGRPEQAQREHRRDEAEPDRDEPGRAELGRQVRAAAGAHHQPERERCHCRAGLETRIAVRGLEVLGQPVERAHEREVREADRRGADPEARVAEVGQVQHRLGHAELPGEEGADEREREGEAAERDRREPAVVRRLDDRVDER